ncbi:tRNA pseudouridine(38-40) synthase TruA [bacterium]|nr:tRNA pseudouridine(38-40) synthase TruA [candidate division CSSED10-310 bacterium]
MRNLKLTFEYDGTHFWGYQRQREGRTVQAELELVLSQITDQAVTLAAAGRTDTGVHASGQVANFHTESSIPVDKLTRGSNSLLPADIVVHSIEDVAPDFHSRFSALSRRYEYTILDRPLRRAFMRLYGLHIPYGLDRSTMITACRHLIGEKDFSSFRAAGDASEHSIRNMINSGGEARGEVFVLFFEANAFLQHMIRIIVGTLLAVGRGRMSAGEFGEVVAAADRSRAGSTAPPHGLCLTNVRYPD